MHDGDATWGDAAPELTTPPLLEDHSTARTAGIASRLAPLLTKILLGKGQDAVDELPIRVLAWDGSSVGPPGAPAFVLRHRRALRRLLWKPGETGLARAYVAGELDIEGDVLAALDAVQRVLRRGDEPIRLSGDDKRDIVRAAVVLGAVGPEPKPPPEESTRHRRTPLAEPTAFFTHLLGPGLAHGTAAWERADDLNAAQSAAHSTVAERLGLFPGARLLDLDYGWGAFARYATTHHDARVVALTRTPDQALPGVEIRGFDLSEAGDEPYDAIVALAGTTSEASPTARLRELLAPGGRLLLRQPTRRPGPPRTRRAFTTGRLLPDGGDPRPLGVLVDELAEAGLEVRGVEALREQHARTLRAWAANLQRGWDECAELVGPGRARVWLLDLAASALACENGRMGVHEILAIR
ncbi:cyclopropane-fatty-acyl-phospholipid synthase family protein [Actinomadura meridiana]|uniref:Cyclopropane-fatty-acyl-phospholipid synthase family protein n=1 Tax=Actinomadura meridiana TaxID=559626 RepID=A0ABP8BSK0_9ACTN